MNSHEDNPFYDLGYTTPEQAEQLRDERLKKQKIDRISAKKSRSAMGRTARRSSVRDFESDRDHADEMAALPPDFVDEPLEGEPIENPRLVARILARRAAKNAIRTRANGDEAEYQRLINAYDHEHPFSVDE